MFDLAPWVDDEVAFGRRLFSDQLSTISVFAAVQETIGEQVCFGVLLLLWHRSLQCSKNDHLCGFHTEDFNAGLVVPLLAIWVVDKNQDKRAVRKVV